MMAFADQAEKTRDLLSDVRRELRDPSSPTRLTNERLRGTPSILPSPPPSPPPFSSLLLLFFVLLLRHRPPPPPRPHILCYGFYNTWLPAVYGAQGNAKDESPAFTTKLTLLQILKYAYYLLLWTSVPPPAAVTFARFKQMDRSVTPSGKIRITYVPLSVVVSEH